ncbi:calaxin-like [Physella acuta]|uniref:calaxin-like n=1 Tax=Physella acuta TaxID=109671 RepID=UPI0027DAF96A|nr:calaxin-like [Physella acuta]
MDFVFDVYDFNQDGVISYNELYYYLKPCVLSFDDEMDISEAVKELIEHVVKISDTDENGHIDRPEFKALVKKNGVYIQLLGPCIPSGHQFEKFRHEMMTLCACDVRKMFANERFSSLNSVKYHAASSLYPVVLELP